MNRLFFIFLLLLLVNNSFSQQLTREFVDNWVRSKDSSFKWEVNTVYSIKNKNYYYKNKDNIDSAISSVSMNELLDLFYLIPTIKPYSPISYNIFIVTKFEMTPDYIEPRLHNVKLYIADKKRFDSTEVFLNDSLVDPKKVFDLIHSLKVADIYFMEDFWPRSYSYFGERLKKYQIKIWTKK